MSSKDHQLSRDELIRLIRNIGTDKYHQNRPVIFDDFYKDHDIDFFAVPTTTQNLERALVKLKATFPKKTTGDRGNAVVPDIAIIYNASKCIMVSDVYKGVKSSDCYKFVASPVDALVEVRALDET